jgi:hypothetical protein
MEAFKFVTKVRNHGIIKIPELESYANQKVDVVITLKASEEDKRSKNEFSDFLKKWAGFFSTEETEDTKYNYLMKKYK